MMLKYLRNSPWISCPRWSRPSSAPTSSTITSSPSRRRRAGRGRGLHGRPEKADAKSVPNRAESFPTAGVKAKGISEKADLEKTAAEKPAVAEKPEKPPTSRRDRESSGRAAPASAGAARKDRAKAVPAPVQPPAAAASRRAAPPVEAAAARKSGATPTISPARRSNACAAPARPRARAGSRAHPGSAARPTRRVVSAPPVQPLPPPIMVSTPVERGFQSGTAGCP